MALFRARITIFRPPHEYHPMTKDTPHPDGSGIYKYSMPLSGVPQPL